MKKYVHVIPGCLKNPISWACELTCISTDLATILIFLNKGMVKNV